MINRLYKRKVSNTLSSSSVTVGNNYRIFVIEISLVEPFLDPDVLNKYHILDLLNFPSKIGLIFGSDLPNIPQFPIYFRKQKAEVKIFATNSTFPMDENTLQLIKIFNKYVYEKILRVVDTNLMELNENSSNGLLLVPLKKSFSEATYVLDIDLLSTDLEIPRFDSKDFENTVVYPIYSKLNNPIYYFVTKINFEMNINSRFPNPKFTSFADYYNQKGLKITNQSQPLLSVIRTPIFSNQCMPSMKMLSTDQNEYLVPELIHIHPIPANLWSTILCIPTILHRLNHFILMDELRCTILTEVFSSEPSAPFEWPKLDYDALLNSPTTKLRRSHYQLNSFEKLSIEENKKGLVLMERGEYPISLYTTNRLQNLHPALLLQALTSLNASDGINLERLEKLGDAYLKFAVSLSMFISFPNADSCMLSIACSVQISNQNLFKLAQLKNIPGFMNATKFEPNNFWLPPGYMLTNKSNTYSVEKTSSNFINFNHYIYQLIPDKSIADVVEALIAATLLSLGPISANKFMNWMGIDVLIDPLSVKPNLPTLLSEEELKIIYNDQSFSSLEKKIAYKFNNKAFLVNAFSHGSGKYANSIGTYDRVEFLGDAILKYLFTDYVFQNNAQFPPGVLSDLESELTNNDTFSQVSVENGLHNCILAIESVINQLKEHSTKSKMSADLLEALVGAIFLDCGMDLDVVWKIIYGLMKDRILNIHETLKLSPVTKLYQIRNDVKRTTEKVGENTRVTFNWDNKKVYADARNKLIAIRIAAEKALQLLNNK